MISSSYSFKSREKEANLVTSLQLNRKKKKLMIPEREKSQKIQMKVGSNNLVKGSKGRIIE